MNTKGKVVAGLLVGGTAVAVSLAELEGDMHVVYADKLAGGIPTVCAGHTDWKMRVGTPYTKEACARINAMNLAKYGEAVIKCSGHTEENKRLNQNSFDAFTLFAVNVGVSGACNSRAMRKLKEGKLEEACEAMAHAPNGRPVWSYVNEGKTFVRGLYKRRLFERDLCLRPVEMPEPATIKVKKPVWAIVLEFLGAMS